MQTVWVVGWQQPWIRFAWSTVRAPVLVTAWVIALVAVFESGFGDEAVSETENGNAWGIWTGIGSETANGVVAGSATACGIAIDVVSGTETENDGKAETDAAAQTPRNPHGTRTDEW